MATTVLLLGRTEIVLDDVRTRIQVDADVELRAGTTLDDVRAAFAEGPVDIVIMGAGLDSTWRRDSTSSDMSSPSAKRRAST